ncbi:iron chelate uptake ABC transporter family permease subunit [Aureimonas glaciei]|uniref:Enterobactin ABC transporter permease n=1 Tax=Aureimonas glaciei TaxID=1776957 RepID=A0A917DDE9_9HYPH|nr:iron chelate uptake ABC transporter family permease subunit [Aureimonas glaciei]GGD28555.1 enterobactin ABC transporter permease [Aureimonas glaciei]
MPPRSLSPSLRITLLALAGLVVVALFMTIGANGSWSFVLPFRGTKVAAMILVGTAIAVSTLLFQTVTANRILTPSIMGLDQLYVLIQTCLVFLAGAAGLTLLGPRWLFVLEIAAMVGFSLLLFRALFSGSVRDLHLLVLVGIVFGLLFRSLSGFLARIIDPNDFVVLQDALFANFNSVDQELLAISAIAVGLVLVLVWRMRHVLDVLALGREATINLGVEHRRMVALVLVLVAILVSVSTALVGPVTFFGLLVVSIAYQITGSEKHRHLLPVASLLGAVTLLAGQLVLERVFALGTALGIVIEFAGGLMFIWLLLKGKVR